MSTHGLLTNDSSAATGAFYRAFEDRHRGHRQLITQRLRVYLPYIVPLAAAHPALPVLDLGCGRGEWLELLGQTQIKAYGVDLDQSMLAACTERALSVKHTEAIAHLSSLPAHSLLAVTGFHIAEHLPFARLQALAAQARRVLVPGGLLILETPNPENLLVGAANFYMDPTHQRPLPWQLLHFLAEHHGFAPITHLRLQEEPRLAAGGPVTLYDVLGNVSPDYAIVAQAPATGTGTESGTAQAQPQPLAPPVGVSLPDLANRYDQQAQHQTTATRQLAEAAQHQAQQALHQSQQLQTDQQQLILQTQQLSATVQQQAHQIQQLQTDQQQSLLQTQQLLAQLSAVYASQSWRLTQPLRWLAQRLSGKPDQQP